ncbi:MAG: IS200/IS605 family element transposase accessory protein TnpB [Candidatus Lokiarchaeota archaeon]|nr:IS200/IS605 family element transposase accessory protein TnpB [Candidatus Lokiarchaeota archaeon]
MKMNKAIKVRLYPNQAQKEMLNKTFGCCRFIYNKMLEERINIYEELKGDNQALYEHRYKTEKEYKEEFEFLKEVDAKALQSEWRHLKSAYTNFFRNLKKGMKGGFPKFKSRKLRQSYTTYNINDNCKIDFKKRKPKLTKIKVWIHYRDDREFDEEIKHITVSRTRSGKYYASILIEIESDIQPKQEIQEAKIIGFDMSATNFLITKRFKFTNPRFYRTEHHKLRKFHKEVNRRKRGSNNRNRSKIKLARIYEKINNRKRDWVHKITHLLSEYFDCIILEDLNITGMQKFNSGISKSVSLDFSWHQFVTILKYKMEQKGKHLILVDRYFPSSKLCSCCGYKNENLELNHREWTCPQCHTHHHRDINASENIEREGKRILRENNIKIISNNDTAVGTTFDAFGEDVRLSLGEQFSMNYESIAL